MSFKDLNALLEEDAQTNAVDTAPRPHILVIDDDESTKDGERRRLIEAVDMAVRLHGLTREARKLVDSLRES